MSSEPTIVTGDRFTVSSNTETEEQIRETLEEPDPIKEAASELGKKGGEASAVKRAERKAKEPEKEDDDEEDEAKALAEAEKLEKEGKLGKPRNDPRARMLVVAREKAEAVRAKDAEKTRADAAEKALADLRAQQTAPKAPEPTPAPKAPEKAAEAPAKPKAEDFETHEAWVEALADYKLEAKLKEREEQAAVKVRAEQEEKTLNTVLGNVRTAANEYAKTDPGWFSKLLPEVQEIGKTTSLMLNDPSQGTALHVIADEIILSDQKDPSKTTGPRLLLHLSDHPEDLQRIKSLRSWQDIQVEMRMLAKSLNGAVTAGTVPKARVSKASTPVQPVTGAPATADPDELDDEAPLSEFVRRGRLREASSRR